MSVHVFGIRHHGPGCARALLGALEELQPAMLLVEGPPDAEGVLPLVAHGDMKPPVALLVYPVDSPKRAVFYPFVDFSPEWQALRFALDRSIPVRFIDLPQGIRMAIPQPSQPTETAPDNGRAQRPEESPVPAEGRGVLSPPPRVAHREPLELLAEAAGYTDHELWWEHQIERHENPTGIFEGIREAMTAVRADLEPGDDEEARREAYMRTSVRAAVKEGHHRIAVVCGAWHAPVLVDHGTAKRDAEILKGLPKTKVEATWIPWTYSRLSFRSGYGAGVSCPGWYHHLWTSPGNAVIRWAVEAARLLRSEDLEASSASVIEVVRLADTLAALRGLRAPGLAELNAAIVSVLCGGDHTRLRLIRERLEVGSVLGSVPAATPMVPLQRDLLALQKSLRLKATTEREPLELDLRNETDRQRSRLFHRLTLLGIPWGKPAPTAGRKLGTFAETWELRWPPEMEVAVVDASIWGETVAAAADSHACHQADLAADLAALTPLLDRALLAEVPHAVDHLLARVQQRAAVGADVQRLMLALPPLVRASRYGDVRQTPTAALGAVIDGLFERILVGLSGACRAIDSDAATERLDAILPVQESLGILDDTEKQAEWDGVLRGLMADDGAHGLIRGWCCRSLFERGRIDEGELDREAGLALSSATPPLDAAAWIEGLLRGSGLVLVHQDGVWLALDRFLQRLTREAFQETLPLLRRAFSAFSAPERRAMGDKVRGLGADVQAKPSASAAGAQEIDLERARLVIPVLAHILGVDPR